ncbi:MULTISPECIES: hypothetical protein [unclassified Psychrobacter]|uniref:hypothetical protein n=3 Tax=unclassified Psychrobacter TaxID=196806 RepID=UPI00402B0BAA
MKSKIIFIIFILALPIFYLAIFYKGSTSMNVFNHEKTSFEDVSLLINESKLNNTSYLASIANENSEKVNINFYGITPPDNSQIILYSSVLGQTIYADDYKSQITVEIPTSLYKKDEGLDSIKFSIYSPDSFDLYTLEQEKPYIFWKKNSVINIHFLHQKKYYDEELALFVGYTVTLHNISK